jgi:type 1 glutamine amidotransferase
MSPTASTGHPQRKVGYLVVGGEGHDLDYVRLELLKMLSEHEHLRIVVAADYDDVAAIEKAEFLISYTSNIAPSPIAEKALHAFVANGKRWLALHASNALYKFTPDGVGPRDEAGLFMATLGSQFVAHPPIAPFRVDVDDKDHPLVRGIAPFDAKDELYLSRMTGQPHIILSTRFTGEAPGFIDCDWPDLTPRPVLYTNKVGKGEVLFFALGHARGHYDAPHRTPYYPVVERGSWDVPEYREILRRSLAWVAGL